MERRHRVDAFVNVPTLLPRTLHPCSRSDDRALQVARRSGEPDASTGALLSVVDELDREEAAMRVDSCLVVR